MRAFRLMVMAVTLAGLAVVMTATPSRADIGDVSVGGVWVCRLTQPALGLTLEERAVLANRQITEVLSIPKFRRGATLYVRGQGPNATIMVEQLVIFTVTPQDAKGTTVSTLELARQWAQRLASGLSKALPDAEFHSF